MSFYFIYIFISIDPIYHDDHIFNLITNLAIFYLHFYFIVQLYHSFCPIQFKLVMFYLTSTTDKHN